MNMPVRNDIFNPTRRKLITAAPAAGLAAMMASAVPVQALTGEVIDRPYLHEIDRPVPSYWPETKPGDLLLIIPGLSRWDDTHLLRSGDFAAIQVVRPDGLVHICDHATGDRELVTRERAEALVAGHIVTRLRMKCGHWIGGSV